MVIKGDSDEVDVNLSAPSTLTDPALVFRNRQPLSALPDARPSACSLPSASGAAGGESGGQPPHAGLYALWHGLGETGLQGERSSAQHRSYRCGHQPPSTARARRCPRTHTRAQSCGHAIQFQFL